MWKFTIYIYINTLGNIYFRILMCFLCSPCGRHSGFPIRCISRVPMQHNKRAFWICSVFFFVSTPPAPTCRLCESLAASLTNLATDVGSEPNFTQHQIETVGRQCGLPLAPLLSFRQTRSKNQQDMLCPFRAWCTCPYTHRAHCPVPASHRPEFHSRPAIHTWTYRKLYMSSCIGQNTSTGSQ